MSRGNPAEYPAPTKAMWEIMGLLGSDYCFDMGYERPIEVLNSHQNLSAQDRNAILISNAARLMRLTAMVSRGSEAGRRPGSFGLKPVAVERESR